MRLGAHLSAAGGVHRAVWAASTLGLESLQVFLRSPGRWAGRQPDEEAVRRCGAGLVAGKLSGKAFAHAPYLLNLASADDALRRRSVDVLVEELQWAGALGLTGVILHPGSAGKGDRSLAESRCREAVAEGVERAGPQAARLLLEGSAGAGGMLGRGPAELSRLVAPPLREKVGICLDLAHLWAAGYDLPGDGWDRVEGELQERWGTAIPDVIHGNDTNTPLGGGVDRHAAPGSGVLGEGFFRRLLRDPRLSATPLIVEMPPGEGNEAVARIVGLLRSWRRSAG